jgi:hypothetical protein
MKDLHQETKSVYMDRYLQKIEEADTIKALIINEKEIVAFFNSIQEEQSHLRYQSNKWSIKEILQHCIDVERIFTYRALCFARNEQTNLPGFDENAYAQNAQADSRNWNELCIEMSAVRKASILLYQGFSQTALLQTGTANNLSINGQTIGRVIAGHWLHHIQVIKERYL